MARVKNGVIAKAKHKKILKKAKIILMFAANEFMSLTKIDVWRKQTLQ